MTALLEASAVSAGYDRVTMIQAIDLRLDDGEIVAMLGANGAGKSTLLKVLAGVLAPIAGDIHIDGQTQVRGLHHRARHGLAYLPEGRVVFSELSVAENLRIGRGAVRDALDLFPELAEHLRRRAGDLSGGQQQMIGLARALAAEPRILLIDELSLGLAPIVVDRLLATVSDTARQGVGVLLVEQHAQRALAVADRALVLNRGRMVLADSASKIGARLGEVERAYLSHHEGRAIT